MNQVIYGLHTIEAKKRISYREAKGIEMIFGTSYPDEAHACSQFFSDGISKFWIEEVVNKAGKRYLFYIKVNMARAIGIGEYCLMPYTVSNINKMIKRISKLLKKLDLDDRNVDFGSWRLERFDSAFDTSVDYPEVFISLLDKSLDVSVAKKQCKRKWFTPTNPNICESIRFGNSSYVYNVYIKLADLTNKGIEITPDIHNEVDNIVRVERQNLLSAVKQLLPNCEVKELASNKTKDAILKALIEDIDAFWGKGDYYSSNEIITRFSSFPEVAKLIPLMVAFTNNSLETEYKLYTSDIKKIFQEYGIMPVGICKNDAHKYQIREITGLYNIVTNHYTIQDKRSYNVFPVPHPCSDGRWKAGITFHKINDTRRQPVSIAKSTLEAYEETVLRELKLAYVTNVKYHCSVAPISELKDKSADDIIRFYQVVKTKSVKEETKRFIKNMNLKKITQV